MEVVSDNLLLFSETNIEIKKETFEELLDDILKGWSCDHNIIPSHYINDALQTLESKCNVKLVICSLIAIILLSEDHIINSDKFSSEQKEHFKDNMKMIRSKIDEQELKNHIIDSNECFEDDLK